MGEKNKKPTFTEAVQAIVESHTRLYALLMEVLPAYRGEAEMPPREKRISRILDCETNDAHRLLENLATAAKAVPRGSLGAEPDILIAECRSFLEFLESNLPCPECAAAINDTCQIEEAFVNFIKGISGGDPGMARRQYSRRIDKFVRDIKTSFRTLGHSIVKLECRQMQFRFLQKAELGRTDNSPLKTPKKRGRIGSGLKGKWTERMCEQLDDFKVWLLDNPIDERRHGRTTGERAHQFWSIHIQTFENDRKRQGERKGFSCHKTLATAFRNS